MIAPTALLAAKHAAASVAVAVAMASTVNTPAPPATSTHSVAEHRTVTASSIMLASSVTSTGSSQTAGVADAYLYTLSQPDLVNQLNEIRSLGVTDLRIVVPWMFIQPTDAATYDWAKMDNVVNTAHAMGFTMTASITMNPTWDGTPLVGAPNPDSYAKFAATVAQRYGGQISAYEVWNEPNAVTFFAPNDPAAYTAVLKAAYTAIKAVQPSATVVAGVLGAVTSVPGLSMAPQQFLAQMYAAGAQGYFDAVSFHPYNYTMPFSAGAGVANSPLEQVQAMYALMAANGDSALKIWATEFGNPTMPGGITQTQQAQMLRDFVTAWSKLSFAGPAFVYTSNDKNTGYLLDENNFGLFTTDGIPKLAAQTLATLISQLAAGTLPAYTAPQLPAAQTIWIQLASLSISVINQAMFIPNIVVAAVYNTLPAPLQQVFATVSAAVARAAGAAVAASAPVAVGAIDAVLNVGPNIQNAAAGINSAVQNAMLAVGTATHNTELTVAGAVQALAGVVAIPNTAASTAASAAAASAAATVTAPAESAGAQAPVAASAVSTAAQPANEPATAASTNPATSTAAGAPANAASKTTASTDSAAAPQSQSVTAAAGSTTTVASQPSTSGSTPAAKSTAAQRPGGSASATDTASTDGAGAHPASTGTKPTTASTVSGAAGKTASAGSRSDEPSATRRVGTASAQDTVKAPSAQGAPAKPGTSTTGAAAHSTHQESHE